MVVKTIPCCSALIQKIEKYAPKMAVWVLLWRPNLLACVVLVGAPSARANNDQDRARLRSFERAATTA